MDDREGGVLHGIVVVHGDAREGGVLLGTNVDEPIGHVDHV